MADGLDQLGIDGAPELWRQFAGELTDGGPGTAPAFLSDDYVAETGAAMGVPPGELSAARRAADVVRSNPRSAALAWLWHRALFYDRGLDPTAEVASDHEHLASWPRPDDDEGLLDGMFPLLILLSDYQHAGAVLAAVGVPDDVAAAALDGVPSCMAAYRERTGRPGLGLMYLSWLLLAFRGRLYRLGALTYQISWLRHDIHVYRRPADSAVALFAGSGVAFADDGLAARQHAEGADVRFTSTFVDDGRLATGHLIGTSGRASAQVTSLPRSQWQRASGAGDPTLALHIPRQTRLSLDDCRESLAAAREFFATYFLAFGYRSLTCTSWMLDPRLAELLPAESNILRFQELFHLFPVPSASTAIYWFVFRGDEKPVDGLPGDTSLQRRLKDYIRAGKMITHGGGVILPDSIPPADPIPTAHSAQS
jgi:hypothetical protein